MEFLAHISVSNTRNDYMGSEKSALIDALNSFAIDCHGAPTGWQWVILERLDDPAYGQMKGGVHDGSTVSSGKKKGQLKPYSFVPGTAKTIIYKFSDFNEFKVKWFRALGMCYACQGEGKIFTGWSASEGYRHTVCTVCEGTGKNK